MMIGLSLAECQEDICAKKWEDTSVVPRGMAGEEDTNKTYLELVFYPVAGCII